MAALTPEAPPPAVGARSRRLAMPTHRSLLAPAHRREPPSCLALRFRKHQILRGVHHEIYLSGLGRVRGIAVRGRAGERTDIARNVPVRSVGNEKPVVF